jgi:hypothetical protein
MRVGGALSICGQGESTGQPQPADARRDGRSIGRFQRTIPCSCRHQAHYRELRSKPVLTVLGKAEVSRPYYLCPHCRTGQFPADVELDIENTEFSPGVRRMQAVVGQEAPFDHGRQQMKLLADLEVTTKAVERTAEAIGEDIAAREQQEIQRAMHYLKLGQAGDGLGVPDLALRHTDE